MAHIQNLLFDVGSTADRTLSGDLRSSSTVDRESLSPLLSGKRKSSKKKRKKRKYHEEDRPLRSAATEYDSEISGVTRGSKALSLHSELKDSEHKSFVESESKASTTPVIRSPALVAIQKPRRGLRDTRGSRYVFNTCDCYSNEISLNDVVQAPVPVDYTAPSLRSPSSSPEVPSSDPRLKLDHIAGPPSSKDRRPTLSTVIGIVRYIGLKQDDSVVSSSGGGSGSDAPRPGLASCVGLELCEPLGNSDGSQIDSRTGDSVRYFSAERNYGIFLDLRHGLRKIPPALLLKTLSGTIQQLSSKVRKLNQEKSELQKEVVRLKKSARAVSTAVITHHDPRDPSSLRYAELIKSLENEINSLKAEVLKEKAVNHELRKAKQEVFSIGRSAAQAASAAATVLSDGMISVDLLERAGIAKVSRNRSFIQARRVSRKRPTEAGLSSAGRLSIKVPPSSSSSSTAAATSAAAMKKPVSLEIEEKVTDLDIAAKESSPAVPLLLPQPSGPLTPEPRDASRTGGMFSSTSTPRVTLSQSMMNAGFLVNTTADGELMIDFDRSKWIHGPGPGPGFQSLRSYSTHTEAADHRTSLSSTGTAHYRYDESKSSSFSISTPPTRSSAGAATGVTHSHYGAIPTHPATGHTGRNDSIGSTLALIRKDLKQQSFVAPTSKSGSKSRMVQPQRVRSESMRSPRQHRSADSHGGGGQVELADEPVGDLPNEEDMDLGLPMVEPPPKHHREHTPHSSLGSMGIRELNLVGTPPPATDPFLDLRRRSSHMSGSVDETPNVPGANELPGFFGRPEMAAAVAAGRPDLVGFVEIPDEDDDHGTSKRQSSLTTFTHRAKHAPRPSIDLVRMYKPSDWHTKEPQTSPMEVESSSHGLQVSVSSPVPGKKSVDSSDDSDDSDDDDSTDLEHKPADSTASAALGKGHYMQATPIGRGSYSMMAPPAMRGTDAGKLLVPRGRQAGSKPQSGYKLIVQDPSGGAGSSRMLVTNTPISGGSYAIILPPGHARSDTTESFRAMKQARGSTTTFRGSMTVDRGGSISTGGADLLAVRPKSPGQRRMTEISSSDYGVAAPPPVHQRAKSQERGLISVDPPLRQSEVSVVSDDNSQISPLSHLSGQSFTVVRALTAAEMRSGLLASPVPAIEDDVAIDIPTPVPPFAEDEMADSEAIGVSTAISALDKHRRKSSVLNEGVDEAGKDYIEISTPKTSVSPTERSTEHDSMDRMLDMSADVPVQAPPSRGHAEDEDGEDEDDEEEDVEEEDEDDEHHDRKEAERGKDGDTGGLESPKKRKRKKKRKKKKKKRRMATADSDLGGILLVDEYGRSQDMRMLSGDYSHLGAMPTTLTDSVGGFYVEPAPATAMQQHFRATSSYGSADYSAAKVFADTLPQPAYIHHVSYDSGYDGNYDGTPRRRETTPDAAAAAAAVAAVTGSPRPRASLEPPPASGARQTS